MRREGHCNAGGPDRCLAAALAGVGALAQAGNADASNHAGTHRAAACAGSQLTLHVDRQGMGAAGHNGLVLQYQNATGPAA